MRGLISFLAGLALIAFAQPARWAQSATKISQHSAWGTYSYQANNSKVCYVLTVPTDKQPASVDHGDMFFFDQPEAGAERLLQPQFIAGYNFKETSKVTVTVGNESFSMFTRGKSAWMENAAQEPQLIAAMKKGSDMSVGGHVRVAARRPNMSSR